MKLLLTRIMTDLPILLNTSRNTSEETDTDDDGIIDGNEDQNHNGVSMPVKQTG
jgi:hypothetical protein